MRAAVRARLLATSGVTALVGARVFTMDTRPQGSLLPAVTIRQIGGLRAYTHDGMGGLVEGRCEINCFGTNGEDCVAVATAVRRALEGLGFDGAGTRVQGVFFEGEQDFSAGAESEGVRVYRIALDAVVWYQET